MRSLDDVIAELEALRESTEVLRDQLRHAVDALSAAAPDPGPPVTTWRGVAPACGIDEDTLAKRRKAAGVETSGRPYFPTADDARAWYRALRPATRSPHAPPQPPPRRVRVTPGPGTTLADARKRHR